MAKAGDTEVVMVERERRNSDKKLNAAELRAGLTPAQLDALTTLEFFRWELRFVRRPLFQDPIPVVFNRDGRKYAVLEPDGSLNENPGFKIRD
ncbi:hypothetical protein [Lysobacter sp. BMK333-48F3]|uniref:hypothetical protein n=1 Tax=Lysobacter sp. BMK333-48F3 TaxID=2867962 RepID=UPI002107D54F|nr:hypothetical protein [Lysobacter sp. BMK333-48F3]